jgi:glycerate dehydrogenase
MRIVVLDGHTVNPGDNPWDPLDRLGDVTVYDRTPDESIVEHSRGAEVLVTNKTPLSAATLDQLPDLQFISLLSTGYDVVDIAAARERGVPVSNVPEYATDAVAQFTFALLLELCHHVGLHARSVRRGEWARSVDFCYWKTPLTELQGKQMGILGFGRIGRRVGELAHAFGMNVLACDARPADEPAYRPFAWRDLAALFAEADVISLHCPHTRETEGVVNADLLSTMKPDTFLINTARGALVVEQDLADALNAGRIAGAALDVAAAEPIAADSPLVTAKNCVVTPHIAWAALAARRRLMHTTAENIAAFMSGEPINVVNRPENGNRV